VQLSSQPGVGGLFNYTITLDNSAASTSPIGTFWYAWTPGQNYLPSSPSTPLTAPSGWSAALTHGGTGDGYGIQYVASSSANYIAPGSFLDFNFETLDSPSALAGNSPHYPLIKVGTSYVYGGGPFTGPSAVFDVQSVPEPANLSLLALGALGFVAARARRYWFA